MSIENMICGDSITTINKMMEMSMERQKTIANNIANASTPGYTRLEIDFQKELTAAVKSRDSLQVSNVKGNLILDERNKPDINGNNVVIPKEMNEMMQNNVLYNLLAKSYGTRMKILKTAISGK